MRNKAIVRCRFRPPHPLHEELARLGSNRRPGDDAVRALACTRRLGDVTRCNSISMPSYGQLCASMASIKPELHNIAMR